jgi:hypothetical protein
MLEQFIARYGEAAILTVSQYVLESGDTLRWILEIDGAHVYADVRVREHPERADVMVMLLVYGHEEVEIARWSKKRHPHGPASVKRRLGDLR